MALRAGLIGLGNMGRHHARVMQETPGIEFIGAADLAGDRHRSFRGIPIVRSTDDLISLGIDLAVVAVPTAWHEAVALELAASGVHCLVEKPLAPTPAAALRMARAFESAGLVGAVGHLERFNPATRALHARLADGELGELHQVATRRQGPFPGRVSDVGVILDLATHDLDLTMHLTGSDYRVLDARVSYRSGRDHEDSVVAVGDLHNKTIVNHVVNWLSPVKERVVQVLGERGAFTADTLTGDLTFFANGSVATQWDAVAAFRGMSEGDVIRFAIPKPEPLMVQMAAFRDAVNGRSVPCPHVSMWEGLRVVEHAVSVQATAEAHHVQRQSDRWHGPARRMMAVSPRDPYRA